jgi:hypothetical protein
MKKRGKKAQSISLNTIVIAALALMVLVILIMIFTGRVDIFRKNLTCTAREGNCRATHYPDGCPPNTVGIMTDDCTDINTGKRPGQCCVPIT